MKILPAPHFFHPSVGGIEPMARAIETLLGEWSARLHYRQVAAEPLCQHNPAAVARKHLKVLERAAR